VNFHSYVSLPEATLFQCFPLWGINSTYSWHCEIWQASQQKTASLDDDLASQQNHPQFITPPSRWFQHVSNMWFHSLLNNTERFNRGCHSVSELGDVVQWWTTRAGQRSITMGHQLNRRCCDTPPLVFGFHLVSSVYNYIHPTGRKTHLLSCDMYLHFCFHLFMYSFVCFLFILFVCFSNYSLIFHASG
jgi:hypothetical protein